MISGPPGFVDMVRIVLKDWDGPSPYPRLQAPCGDPGPRLSKEDQVRWFKHIIMVGERELPSLKTSNPAAAHCLQILFDLAKDKHHMTKDTEPQKLWALTKTEYAGQCTGYSSETVWLGLFPKLPDIKTLAPFIGSYLSNDMGVAISEVQTLIDKKEITLKRDYHLALSQIPVGVPLNL